MDIEKAMRHGKPIGLQLNSQLEVRLHLTHQALDIRSADAYLCHRLPVDREGSVFSNGVAISTNWAAPSLPQIVAFICPLIVTAGFIRQGAEGEAEEKS